MTMASLTASLLARKGQAQPSATARDIFAPANPAPDDESAHKRWQSPIKPRVVADASHREVGQQQASHQKDGQDSLRPHSPVAAKVPAREDRLPRPAATASKPVQKSRHARLVSPGEGAAKPDGVKSPARKHKSLRLDEATDLQLRLLAARQGSSQQAVMEKALKALLRKELEDGECICRASASKA